MLSRALSVTLEGIDATLVHVEVHASPGIPSVNTVGLPDSAVRESRERVRSAMINSGLTFPQKRLTVNLAPAARRKAGASLDLAVAVAIAALEDGVVERPTLERTILMGELALDGRVRAVPGVLAAALEARRRSIDRIVVPRENVEEARLVERLVVVAVGNLNEAIGSLGADREPAPPPPSRSELTRRLAIPGDGTSPDMSEVRGQPAARRALEVAAAGGHNLLMIGPPGSGKTMLARRLPSILPPMSLDEALDVTRIHGVAGPEGTRGLIVTRPFRSPHHTASQPALVGGGGGLTTIRPGEASLAHHGVLFLDELAEFERRALEALRQPLEDGYVDVARAAASVRFPACFTLVASMNPCMCGYLGSRTMECACTPPQIARYRGRVSGPILDRIDLHVEVPAVRYREISAEEPAESSHAIRLRVVAARRRQRDRCPDACNARLPVGAIREHCVLDPEGGRLMERAMTTLGLSARAHDRVLKVARTIADLEGSERVERDHLAEARQYRGLDRR